jgi:glycosyltransferase involved in cell wall biosynthesis
VRGCAIDDVVAAAPAWVEGNRWDRLPTPTLGSWTPHLSIAVVVPAKDQPLLVDVVEAIADQSYPDDLVEILVVDDGSERPLEVAELSDRARLRTRVLRHRFEGFGAGAARRAGAAAATNDVLAFLDSDVRVPHHYLEAHARWHHVAGNAVVVGQMRMLREEVDGTALRIEPGPEWDPVAWVAAYLERTDDLREDHRDVWSVTTGASVSVRRDFHARFGGFAGFGIRGIEDIEFGYRSYVHGAVVVPERDGYGWHPPERYFSDPERGRAAKQRRSELLADRVPTAKTRSDAGRRIRSVPDTVVHLAVPDAEVLPTDRLVDGVDRALVLARPTTEFVLHGVTARPDAAVVEDAIRADPRVRLAEQHRDESLLAGSVAYARLEDLSLVRRLLDELDHPLGLVGVSHADREPTVAVAGRALNRARFATGAPTDGWVAPATLRVVQQLFGASWSDDTAPTEGLRRRTVVRTAGGPGSTDPELLAHLASVEAELQRVRAEHRRLRSRRAVRLANRVARLRLRLSGRR